MKKIKLITVITLMLIGNFSFAENGENKFKKQITNHILYPKLEKLIENSVNVFVKFTILDSCSIKIDKIETTNVEFKNYVIQKLNELSNNIDIELIGKTFEYNFTFEVQK